MQVSINTATFLSEMQRGVSQSDCVRQLVDRPIDNIEVRGEFFKPATQSAELQVIEQLCIDQQWGLYYSVPMTLFEGNQLNDQLTDYIHLANQFHFKGLKFSLGDASHISTDALSELITLTESTDTVITVENQPNAFSAMPQFGQQLRSLLTSVPKLGYTFDAGNWYWINTQPGQAFDALKRLITVFHLKDIDNQQTVLLGDGDTDWQTLVTNLNPTSPIFLEYDIVKDQLAGQIDLVNHIIVSR